MRTKTLVALTLQARLSGWVARPNCELIDIANTVCGLMRTAM